MEADGAVDAQNAPTVPWKTLCVFHELPQGLSNQITHEKPRKAPKWRWETRIDPEKAEEYEGLGIRGVDLYIATFGPVLSVISERWPVLTSEVDPNTNKPMALRPEAALEIAREEVLSRRKRGLLLGRRVRFDPVTDWYLLAWDAFRAEQFPADEARKLCMALDVDLEGTVVRAKRLLTKKGKNVGSSHKCVHDSAPSRSATPWKEAADVFVPANQR